MMFLTRRQLKKKIADLESQLHIELRKNKESALISKAELPKCKGLYCFQCAYAV